MRPVITLIVCFAFLFILFILFRIKQGHNYCKSEFWTDFFRNFEDWANILSVFLLLIGMLSTFESVIMMEKVYIWGTYIQTWIVAYSASFCYLAISLVALVKIIGR